MDLKGCQKTRQYLKSKLTNFKKFVDKISDEIKADKSKITPVIELETRIEQIKDVLVQFDQVQSQISVLIDEESEEIEHEYHSSFENTYYETVSKAKQLIKSAQSETQGQSVVSSSNTTQQIILDNSGFKLPHIQLPKFNGNFENWLEFRDSFQAMIISNNNISLIQKFHYLKSCLTNSAQGIISSLTLSATNFNVAWQLLCDRYDNEQILVHNHIRAIFNIKPIRENSVCIRQLVDNICGNLRSLKALGEPTEHWDSLITYIILEKLDPETVKDWDKECRGKRAVFNHLLDFLRNRAETLEKFEIRSNKFHNLSKSKPAPTSRVLVSKEVPNNVCLFCHGKHKISVCSNFQNLDVSSRNNEVRKLKLCFNCLHLGHQSDKCQYGHCKHCGKKHHSLLHRENSNANVSSNDQHPLSGSQVPNDRKPSSDYQVPNDGPSSLNSQVTNALSSNIVQGNYALLSTVIVQIRDEDGVAYNCRALLDCGSQSNFITHDLVKKLRVNKKPADISVIGIGPSFVECKVLV